MSEKIAGSPTVLKRIKYLWNKSRSEENISSTIFRSKSVNSYRRKHGKSCFSTDVEHIATVAEKLCEPKSVVMNTPMNFSGEKPVSLQDIQTNGTGSIKQIKTRRRDRIQDDRSRCKSSIFENSSRIHSSLNSENNLSSVLPCIGTSYQKLQATSDYLIPQEHFSQYVDTYNVIYKVPSSVPRLDHPNANDSPEIPPKQYSRQRNLIDSVEDVRQSLAELNRNTPDLKESIMMDENSKAKVSSRQNCCHQSFVNDSVENLSQHRTQLYRCKSQSDEYEPRNKNSNTKSCSSLSCGIDTPSAYKRSYSQVDSESISRSAYDISATETRSMSPRSFFKRASGDVISQDTIFGGLLQYNDEDIHSQLSNTSPRLNHSDSYLISDSVNETSDDLAGISRYSKSRHSSRDDHYIEVNFKEKENNEVEKQKYDDRRSYCHKTSFESKHSKSYVKLILNK